MVSVVSDPNAHRDPFRTPLHAALTYALEFGWSVVPVDRQTKQPPIKWKQYQSETADEKTIRAWFSQHPMWGVGIVTGAISDLWVVDVDGPHGQARMDEVGVPDGPVSRTNKGQHRYYKWPVGAKNTANADLGLDSRGEGGFITAPPSQHQSGRLYEWIVSPRAVAVPDAPDALVTLFDTPAPMLTLVPSDNELVTLLREGQGEGGRNQSAARLAGHFIGLGVPEDEVSEILTLWNGRCTPPLPLQELRASVKSIAQAEARKQTLAGNLTVLPPWPIMDQDAYYGVAGDIVRLIEPHTEADPAALLVNFLTMFGNAVGPTAHTVVSGARHPLNMFAAIVGDTAAGRKGSSMGYLKRLFSLTDLLWLNDRVMGGLSSGEGIIAAVKDEDEHDTAIDPVPTDKRLLVVEEEFANVLKVSRREGNTISGIVRQAWDGGTLHLLTKAKMKASDPHISILAHVTTQELRKLLSDTDLTNGFVNRFLWVCSRRSKYLPEGGGVVTFGSITRRLHEALAFGMDNHEPYTRDEDARDIWGTVYKPLSDRPAGTLGVVTGRAAAYVLRLSVLYAVLDRSPQVREPHLSAALAVWDYCEQSARYIFGDATGDPVTDSIINALRAAGDDGLDLSAISDLFGRHVSAAKRKAILDDLEEQGRIERRNEKTGGRDRVTFTLAP